MFCWYYFFLQTVFLSFHRAAHYSLFFIKLTVTALVLPPAAPINKHKLDILGWTHLAVRLLASCYCKHISRIFFSPVHRFPILRVWSLKKFLNIAFLHKYNILYFRPQQESQNRKTGNNETLTNIVEPQIYPWVKVLAWLSLLRIKPTIPWYKHNSVKSTLVCHPVIHYPVSQN